MFVLLCIAHFFNSENGYPLMMNRFTLRYNLGSFTLILRGVRCDFNILIHFFDEIL